jgi:hypothetical protein
VWCLTWLLLAALDRSSAVFFSVDCASCAGVVDSSCCFPAVVALLWVLTSVSCVGWLWCRPSSLSSSSAPVTCD